MKSGATIMPQASGTVRRTGFFKNLLYWLMDWDDPATLEEGRRRLRSAPGYLASLSPEAREYLRNYDGPENHGPPLTRRERRDLQERLARQAIRPDCADTLRHQEV